MRFLVVILLVFAAACDGKPCSEKPEYSEYDEELVEALDDILDDADAYDHQRTRVFAINKGLDDDRAKFRVSYEAIRAKMIDQLVAVNLDVTAFHGLLNAMQSVFMTYVYEVIDVSLPAHRFFTQEQRKEMTEGWEEPPDEYKLPWATKRGIDLAMAKIDATDAQKAQVEAMEVEMEKSADKLMKDQHRVRMKLIGQWHQPKIDAIMVRKHIDEGAAQISTFLHGFADNAFTVAGSLTPQQRMWTNQQVNKLRRCSK